MMSNVMLKLKVQGRGRWSETYKRAQKLPSLALKCFNLYIENVFWEQW